MCQLSLQGQHARRRTERRTDRQTEGRTDGQPVDKEATSRCTEQSRDGSPSEWARRANNASKRTQNSPEGPLQAQARMVGCKPVFSPCKETRSRITLVPRAAPARRRARCANCPCRGSTRDGGQNDGQTDRGRDRQTKKAQVAAQSNPETDRQQNGPGRARASTRRTAGRANSTGKLCQISSPRASSRKLAQAIRRKALR